MAQKRRIDIHVDFQFKRAKGPEGDNSDKVLTDIDRFIRRRLRFWPNIQINNVTWERQDFEAGMPIMELTSSWSKEGLE